MKKTPTVKRISKSAKPVLKKEIAKKGKSLEPWIASVKTFEDRGAFFRRKPFRVCLFCDRLGKDLVKCLFYSASQEPFESPGQTLGMLAPRNWNDRNTPLCCKECFEKMFSGDLCFGCTIKGVAYQTEWENCIYHPQGMKCPYEDSPGELPDISSTDEVEEDFFDWVETLSQ